MCVCVCGVVGHEPPTAAWVKAPQLEVLGGPGLRSYNIQLIQTQPGERSQSHKHNTYAHTHKCKCTYICTSASSQMYTLTNAQLIRSISAVWAHLQTHTTSDYLYGNAVLLYLAAFCYTGSSPAWKEAFFLCFSYRDVLRLHSS